jgi:hypothetical protein
LGCNQPKRLALRGARRFRICGVETWRTDPYGFRGRRKFLHTSMAGLQVFSSALSAPAAVYWTIIIQVSRPNYWGEPEGRGCSAFVILAMPHLVSLARAIWHSLSTNPRTRYRRGVLKLVLIVLRISIAHVTGIVWYGMINLLSLSYITVCPKISTQDSSIRMTPYT